MRPLDDPRTLQSARSAFERVFDPRWDVAPFRPQLPDRVLMYPVDYTMLEPEQFGAVAAAVDAATSEDEAFLAALGEPGSGWGGTYDHAVVALGDYASYKPPDTLVLEHTLFSPS